MRPDPTSCHRPGDEPRAVVSSWVVAAAPSNCVRSRRWHRPGALGRRASGCSRRSRNAVVAPADQPAAAAGGPRPPAPLGQGGPDGGPVRAQLERKELRIRVEQADELARLTRRINRSRRGAGERITDNTLIRVAVDLLLERSAHIAGTTEDELRESLTSTGGDVNRPG